MSYPSNARRSGRKSKALTVQLGRHAAINAPTSLAGGKGLIHGRRLNEPLSPVVRINQLGTSSSHPVITSLVNGGYVVTWQSSGLDFDGSGIYGQVYDAARTPVGAQFQVNTVYRGEQDRPSVTAIADGFVIAWQSFGSGSIDLSSYGVVAQIYDASGAKVGGEVQINTQLTDSQRFPKLASIAGGGFVSVWRSYDQDGSEGGIYAQLFNSAGAKVGGELLVNSATAGNQDAPAVAGLSEDGFVVAWQTRTPDGLNWTLSGRTYTQGAFGKEFIVRSAYSTSQMTPSVAALAGNEFVIVFEGVTGSFTTGIFGQVYEKDGSIIGAEFVCHSGPAAEPGRRINPSVASLKSQPVADFIVTWTSLYGQDGDGQGSYANIFKLYNSGPTAMLMEFLVSDSIVGDQADAQVTALPDGTFMIVFASSASGKTSMVGGRWFEANPDFCKLTLTTCSSTTECCEPLLCTEGLCGYIAPDPNADVTVTDAPVTAGAMNIPGSKSLSSEAVGLISVFTCLAVLLLGGLSLYIIKKRRAKGGVTAMMFRRSSTSKSHRHIVVVPIIVSQPNSPVP